MPLVECLLSVLYSSMNVATARLACSRVAKWCRLSNSNSRVELNDSETALSRAEPVRPMDWVTPALRQACTKRLPVYSPPWSVWNSTPATAPPRIAMATHSAARASAASWWMPMANPTQRRECRSSTAASWSLPSSVGISVRSPDQRTSGRGGGVKSRRSPSGALRADLSGLVVPRRVRLRRAIKPCSTISVATVLTLTRHPSARRSAVIRGDPYVPLWRGGRGGGGAARTPRPLPRRGGALPRPLLNHTRHH